MRADHLQFVQCSGQLAVTGAQACLYIHLQPEWQDYDERPYPLDAPSFFPRGSCVQYDSTPLANLGLIDRRIS